MIAVDVDIVMDCYFHLGFINEASLLLVLLLLVVVVVVVVTNDFVYNHVIGKPICEYLYEEIFSPRKQVLAICSVMIFWLNFKYCNDSFLKLTQIESIWIQIILNA